MNLIRAATDWNEIVRRIADQKDTAAFKLLFEHFYEPLLQFSISITGDRAASEDVISELMVKIWTCPSKILFARNLKTYLFISVKNSSLNVLSRKRTSERYLNSLPENSGHAWSPEDQLLSKELARQLELAIADLTPKTKMAFLLIRDNGCSYAEAAEIMEISTKTVDRHIQIALTKIRASIDW